MSNIPVTPQLVTSDFTADSRSPIPSTLMLVGTVVHFNATPSFSDIAVQLEPQIEVKPGQFLAVWHGRRGVSIFTVIQVNNCSEHNPNEEPDLANARKRLGLADGYAGEGVSTRIYRLAQCQTLEEFESVEEPAGWKILATRSPEALARAGDPVVLLPGTLGIAAIGGLPDPGGGLNVGKLYGPDPEQVTLTPDVLQMHVGVFGNPGKGKSYFSGIMLEEARAWDVPTLVLDVNGENAEAARALGGLVITLPDKTQFGLALNLLTPKELVSVAPNVQPNTQYAELIELAHERLRNQGRGAGITFEQICSEIDALGTQLEIRQPSVKAAISRLSALKKDPLFGGDFDFIATLKSKGLVVLDCRYLSLKQTRLIAAAAARTLQKYGRDMAQAAEAQNASEETKRWFALFMVDEAHAVVPNDEDVVSTQVLYELARMGRHVRTGLLLSSQSPADLDRSVLKRLQTRFVFALERDQLAAIGGIQADLGDELLTRLPKLPRGVCAVTGTSELVRHGFLLAVKERSTPVGGKTAPVFVLRKKKE